MSNIDEKIEQAKLELEWTIKKFSYAYGIYAYTRASDYVDEDYDLMMKYGDASKLSLAKKEFFETHTEIKTDELIKLFEEKYYDLQIESKISADYVSKYNDLMMKHSIASKSPFKKMEFFGIYIEIKTDELIRLFEEKYYQLNSSFKISSLMQQLRKNYKLRLFMIIEQHPQLITKIENLEIIVKHLCDSKFRFYYSPSYREMAYVSEYILMDDKFKIYFESNELYRCWSILHNDDLCKNANFKEALLTNIVNGQITNFRFSGHYDVGKILCKNPNFDCKFLLLLMEDIHIHREAYKYNEIVKSDRIKNYILERLNNEDNNFFIDLLNLFKKGFDFNQFGANILSEIAEIYNNGIPHDNTNTFIKRSDGKLHRLIISILWCVQPNRSNFDEYLQKIQQYEDQFELSMSQIEERKMLKHKDIRIVLFQDSIEKKHLRLFELLKIKEVRDNILNKDDFYHYLLAFNNMGYYYATPRHLLYSKTKEGECVTDEMLLNLFSNNDFKFVYFYDKDRKLVKTPITYYMQLLKFFLSPLFLSGSFPILEDSSFTDLPFYDAEILGAYLEKRNFDLAAQIINIGANKGLDYDLNSEIFWNELFCEYYKCEYYKSVSNYDDESAIPQSVKQLKFPN